MNFSILAWIACNGIRTEDNYSDFIAKSTKKLYLLVVIQPAFNSCIPAN